MQIVSLTAENVKRLKAVQITPTGQVVEITGKNAQGKSSVLDSIMYALAGEKSLPTVPVRNGEKKAKIVVDLGDLKVTRTMTADGGGTLTVSSKDGARYPSPQAMLDTLTGRLCFDPLAFTRQPAKAQAATLQKLVGLDFTDQDNARKTAFDGRTLVNRDVKALEAQVAAAPSFPDAPKEEVSITDALAQLRKAEDVNKTTAALQSQARQSEQQQLNERASVVAAEKLLAEAKARLQAAIAKRDKDAARAAESQVIDVAPFETAVATAEDVNRKVRSNAARAALEARLEQRKADAEALGKRIAAIDAAKEKALREAKFPVPGLTFDANGVYYNGVPFSQASAREQVVVSAAMGMALNPKLRVLLIRDGSLLDADAMADLGKWAEENKAQIWIERVAGDKDVGIVIEDGAVRKAPGIVQETGETKVA